MKLFLLFLTIFTKFTTHIGGQAILSGLIMRSYNRYALAVRNYDNQIIVEHHTWYSLSRSSLLKKNFIRGFPILLETLINGVKALNRSAELTDFSEKKTSPIRVLLCLIIAILFAVLLFVIIPHMFAAAMETINYGGTINEFSFHIWDGIFKIILFLLYIYFISFFPDIRNVLQYHGAEHKVISCYESGMTVNAANAKLCSRLHPRCGTSFILFVILLAIIMHSIFVPIILFFPLFENTVIMHSVVILFKIVLIIPISAVAYEIIRATANRTNSIFMKLLSFPGMFLQILTTKEPDIGQLEVAVIALREVVAENQKNIFETVNYINIDKNEETKDSPCSVN